MYKVYGYLPCLLKHSADNYGEKEKELAMKEFESSKIKNEFLKAQVNTIHVGYIYVVYTCVYMRSGLERSGEVSFKSALRLRVRNRLLVTTGVCTA